MWNKVDNKLTKKFEFKNFIEVCAFFSKVAIISEKLNSLLSPSSIRSVMAKLEEQGYLYSPHTSSGRMPTDRGLKLFVDGLLELGDLTKEEEESSEEKRSGEADNNDEL